jgi:hypothetical protein
MYNAIWLFLYGGCWLEPFSIYPGPLLDGSDHKMIGLVVNTCACLSACDLSVYKMWVPFDEPSLSQPQIYRLCLISIVTL